MSLLQCYLSSINASNEESAATRIQNGTCSRSRSAIACGPANDTDDLSAENTHDDGGALLDSLRQRQQQQGVLNDDVGTNLILVTTLPNNNHNQDHHPELPAVCEAKEDAARQEEEGGEELLPGYSTPRRTTAAPTPQGSNVHATPARNGNPRIALLQEVVDETLKLLEASDEDSFFHVVGTFSSNTAGVSSATGAEQQPDCQHYSQKKKKQQLGRGNPNIDQDPDQQYKKRRGF